MFKNVSMLKTYENDTSQKRIYCTFQGKIRNNHLLLTAFIIVSMFVSSTILLSNVMASEMWDSHSLNHICLCERDISTEARMT